MARRAVFPVEHLRVCSLESEDGSLLQNMFERCDDYFEAVGGHPAGPAESQSTYMVLPEGKGCEDKFLLGLFDDKELIGVLDAVRDYPKQGIWWIGLMLLVPERRGRGLGKKVYHGLEKWIAERGGQEVRLAVAEPLSGSVAFWRNVGFEQLDRRPLKVGQKESMFLVMSKSLLTSSS